MAVSSRSARPRRSTTARRRCSSPGSSGRRTCCRARSSAPTATTRWSSCTPATIVRVRTNEVRQPDAPVSVMLRPERLTAIGRTPRRRSLVSRASSPTSCSRAPTARIIVHLPDDSEVIASVVTGTDIPFLHPGNDGPPRVDTRQRVPALRMAAPTRCDRQRHRHPRGPRRLLNATADATTTDRSPLPELPATRFTPTKRATMTNRRPIITPRSARGAMTRRQLLIRAGALGAVGVSLPSLLAACGGSDSDSGSAGSQPSTGSAAGGGGGSSGAVLRELAGLHRPDRGRRHRHGRPLHGGHRHRHALHRGLQRQQRVLRQDPAAARDAASRSIPTSSPRRVGWPVA